MNGIEHRICDIITEFEPGCLIESVVGFYSFASDSNNSVSKPKHLLISLDAKKKFIVSNVKPENESEKYALDTMLKNKKTKVIFNTLVFDLYDVEANCLLSYIIYFENSESTVQLPFIKVA